MRELQGFGKYFFGIGPELPAAPYPHPRSTNLLKNPGHGPITRPMTYKVVAFYRFVSLTDLPQLQAKVKQFCIDNGVWGTTLLAPEGVNGTMAGLPEAIDAFVPFMDSIIGISAGELKYSTAQEMPFERVKIKVKKEIITFKQECADPNVVVGTYVEPQDWNALISDPEVLVLDTRNDYETKIGIFENTIDPNLERFTQFATYVDENLDPAKHKKVAMFCTGGIRCEKASSYMKAKGFEEVYHLKGGILKYLEVIPPEQSLWKGACYVFDERVALEHGLQEANIPAPRGYTSTGK